MRTRRFLFPIIILLFAALFRLHHLDFRALWWDEGLSLFFARLDYVGNAQMAVTLADTNPPIYRMLLGLWLNLVGWSPFTARLFSVLPGIILVAIVYRLARELRFPRETALTAMALCAASPMLIYYAQEAKGYSLVAMAATGSVLLWVRLHSNNRLLGFGVNGFKTDKRIVAHNPFIRSRSASVDTPTRASINQSKSNIALWLLWSLMLLLLIGSHYIAAFLLVVENLWTAALTLRSRRGNGRFWAKHWTWQIGMQAVVAAALLPFVLLTFGGTSAVIRGETGDFIGLNGPAQFFGQHLVELTQGPTASGGRAGVTAGVVVGLLVIGYWRIGDRRIWDFEIWDLRFEFWGLLSWIILPILLGFVLNSYHQFFFPRFVLYTVPAIMVLVANGILQIANRLSCVVRLSPSALGTVNCALCIALWTPTLLTHYNTPTDPAEDWRPLAETLHPLVRDDDAAIYTWGWIPGYLDAYLPNVPRPDYHLGFFTPESLDPEMKAIASGKRRVWLLDYQVDQFDVRNMAGRWLGERAALVYDQWFGLGHAALFALEPTFTSGGKIEFDFANGLRLTTQQINAQLAPGEALAVQLAWTPTQPLSDRATIFLHGLAADGSLAFGRDSEPDNGLSAVTDWRPGGTYTELRGALLPPDLPAGTYTLQIGIYDTLTGEPDSAGPMAIGSVVVK